MSNWVLNHKKYLSGITILFFSLITGVLIFNDYGISWDEPLQRTIGMKTYGYMFEGDKSYETLFYKEYGVAFEVPLIMIEKILSLKDPSDIFRMRHLTSHLFFLTATFVFYLLIRVLYNNRLLAITGYLMLLLSPRIFAHSFFNTKDIPFMSMFIICFFFIAIAFLRKKSGYFILAGLCSGLLVNIRVMGILIPFLTIFFLLIDLVKEKEKKKIVLFLFVYIISACGILFISWPYLWEDPLGNFAAAFTSMSKYRWDNYVLMFGEFVRSTKLGWWYFPSWFVITTPLVYLILGITGMTILCYHVLRCPVKFLTVPAERIQLLFLACLLIPIMAVIVMHSVLYDTWRQLFFIYPSFLLMAIYGLSSILSRKSGNGSLIRFVMMAIIAISFVNTVWFMVKSHPFQDVYFNKFVSQKDQSLRKNFEMNFWGTGYKQALEYILDNDKRAKIRIMTANMPGEHNLLLMAEQDRKRVQYVYSVARANYFITNYRWHPGDYGYLPTRQFFTVNVLNSDIISVWKLQ
jgi:hypothetical protein